MNLYCASVCTIPERWERTIWMVFGTSMSQSTPETAKTIFFYKLSHQDFIWTQDSWSEECRWSHADSPFSLITSIRMSITINVPVLPIPALKSNTGSLSQHVPSAPTSSVCFRVLMAHVFSVWRCVPAVYGYGPSVQYALLLQVDLL